MKKAAFILILPFLFLLSACEDEVKTGTVKIHLYSENLKNHLDDGTYPDFDTMVETLDIELYSLVQIKGLTPEYYMGDKYGRITISNVPEGTYTVHPLFMNAANDIQVTVSELGPAQETILMPKNGTYGILVHSNFKTKEIRRALSIGISRADLLGDRAEPPAYRILPAVFYTDGLFTSAAISESVSEATTLLGGSSFDFTYIYNTSTNHQAVADYLKAKWESYANIGTVTLQELDWDTIQTTAYIDKNYEVVRFGWYSDSNNPYAFLEAIIDRTAYSSAELDQMTTELESALTAGDSEAFLDYLDRFHTLILDEGLFIPVYEYIF